MQIFILTLTFGLLLLPLSSPYGKTQITSQDILPSFGTIDKETFRSINMEHLQCNINTL